MACETIKMEISANPDFVSIIRLTTSGIANKIGFSIDDIEDDKSVSITYTILENGLDIEIKDNGKGYDVESIATPDLTQPKENGLGLFIIQTLMDDVKIESKDNQGTIIKMTKYVGVDI